MSGTKYEPNTTQWEMRESDFPGEGSTEEKVRFLLRYAVLAPSSHNSQPWKFSVQDNEIRIFADKTRWLKVADADQRELYISTGCALENLLIAAEHFGYGHAVEYFPEDVPDAVACVRLVPGGRADKPRGFILFDMIPRRSTNHSLYDTRQITETEMTRLHTCCDEEGFRLFATNEAPNEKELRRRIDDLITQADALQFTDAAYRKELAWWIGQGVFGASWLIAKVTQLAVAHINVSKGQAKKDSELLLSAPSLITLGSTDNDRKSQVIAGQIFERIALAATHMGMAVHPMNQILELPRVKAEVSSLLPEENIVPQHTFRLGYAQPEKEHTPRRPVEEVLVENMTKTAETMAIS